MSYKLVFNTGAAPVEVDEAGHMAYPGDWTGVLDNPVLDQAIASGRVQDRTEQITETSSPEAWAAKLAADLMVKATTPQAVSIPADSMSTEVASSAVPPKNPAK